MGINVIFLFIQLYWINILKVKYALKVLTYDNLFVHYNIFFNEYKGLDFLEPGNKNLNWDMMK